MILYHGTTLSAYKSITKNGSIKVTDGGHYVKINF